jgi:hypothetical protein
MIAEIISIFFIIKILMIFTFHLSNYLHHCYVNRRCCCRLRCNHHHRPTWWRRHLKNLRKERWMIWKERNNYGSGNWKERNKSSLNSACRDWNISARECRNWTWYCFRFPWLRYRRSHWSFFQGLLYKLSWYY